ncbi:hypothetical protein D9611_013159 [Ephemerocybe angulata]|uniref:Uncharacterized protein n=1 Tax=Ephemerocybe angulata TaxID=980116 RepID=A0A8H5BTM3_9AGAR|nr:hypothetical protein D9611_013159 [Tulosesus angulatus]
MLVACSPLFSYSSNVKHFCSLTSRSLLRYPITPKSYRSHKHWGSTESLSAKTSRPVLLTVDLSRTSRLSVAGLHSSKGQLSNALARKPTHGEPTALHVAVSLNECHEIWGTRRGQSQSPGESPSNRYRRRNRNRCLRRFVVIINPGRHSTTSPHADAVVAVVARKDYGYDCADATALNVIRRAASVAQ